MLNKRAITMHNWDAMRLQRKAHGIVARAKQFGILPIPDGSIDCTDCDAKAIEYDHRNYFKPLDVEPVCRSCNLMQGPGYPFSVEKPRRITSQAAFGSCRDWLFIPETQELITVYPRHKLRQKITVEMFCELRETQ